ncbi:hypothetical protein [Halobacteriovorax sp. CON-3]|uniref:hypothetical protein n=1 Tax=Halobacteriovorax sp. CON-3 TaxID=3157710 RepID=UPI00371C3979
MKDLTISQFRILADRIDIDVIENFIRAEYRLFYKGELKHMTAEWQDYLSYNHLPPDKLLRFPEEELRELFFTTLLQEFKSPFPNSTKWKSIPINLKSITDEVINSCLNNDSGDMGGGSKLGIDGGGFSGGDMGGGIRHSS